MSIQARRHSPRFALHETVYVNFGANTRAVILDVSEGGLRFKTASPIEQAGPLRFWLTSTRQNDAEAHIAWTDESRTIGGLRFTSVPVEMRQQFRAWINRAQSEPHTPLSLNEQIEAERALAVSSTGLPSTEADGELTSVIETSHETSPLDSPLVAVNLTAEPPLVSAAANEALRAGVERQTGREIEQEIDREIDRQAAPETVTAASSPDTAAAFVPESAAAPLFLSRPNLVGKPGSLSMFSSETARPGAYTLAVHQRSHRAAIAVLVLLILLGAAAGAAGYYYPAETKYAMSRVQARVEQFINPAHKQSVTAVEPASMGGSLEAANPDASAPASTATPSTETPNAAQPDSSSKSAALSISPAAGAARENESAKSKSDGAASSAPASASNATSDAASETPAVKNNSGADLQLAQQYLAGSNPDEKTKAVQLLWLATEKGNVDAEVLLAGLYASGHNVPKSCVQARILLKAASATNPAAAKPKLSELDQSGCS